MRILVVDSDTAEINEKNRAATGLTTGEGYAAALKTLRSDVEVTVVAPYMGQGPVGFELFDGAAFTGSGVDWCTDDPQARPLAKVMEACFQAGLPVVGSCNGMQLAATVLGGRNRASPKGREDGLALDIHLTTSGAAHRFMDGRRDGYAVPCVHRDEVDCLPKGAEVLAFNAHSAVQAFAYEHGDARFWGVQYHPEYTLPFIAERTRAWKRVPDEVADDIAQAADSLEAAARLGVRIEDMQPAMSSRELRNWLNML